MIVKAINLKYLYWLSYLVLLIIAGLGFQRILVVWTGFVYSLFCVLFLIKTKIKVLFPKGFKIYVYFLIFFAISLTWSNNFFVSFPHLLNFVAAGLFWLFFYNLKLRYPDTQQELIKVLLITGVAFGSLFLLQNYLGIERISSFGLNGYTSTNFNHHHVGDLFAILILLAVYQILSGKRNIKMWLIFLIPATYILFISGSRSGIVALFGGFLYLFNFSKEIKKTRALLLNGILFLLLLGFLYISSYKVLLLSREYYVQAVAGLIKYPLGVGVGNFSVISSDPRTHLFGLGEYSIATHNIILEFMSGMGVLGFTFVYWFFFLVVGLLKKFKEKDMLVNSLLVIFAVNFFFDITYFIPTMLWVWFALLGIRSE